ncbi:unnamed protein product, partial [Ceratitis capitata]
RLIFISNTSTANYQIANHSHNKSKYYNNTKQESTLKAAEIRLSSKPQAIVGNQIVDKTIVENIMPYIKMKDFEADKDYKKWLNGLATREHIDTFCSCSLETTVHNL